MKIEEIEVGIDKDRSGPCFSYRSASIFIDLRSLRSSSSCVVWYVVTLSVNLSHCDVEEENCEEQSANALFGWRLDRGSM